MVKKKYLLFAFEFGEDKYYKGSFGVVRKSNAVNITGDIITKFNQQLKNLGFPLKSLQWWLHSESLPKNYEDFTSFVLFKNDAQKIFTDRILELINIFEINSNLISDINEYLNNESENIN